MKYENRVVRVQNLFFHTLPERIERWQEEGYRIINTNQSKTFSGEEEIVIFLEREVEEKKQKTNYDRIKSMSVEEMAGLIVDFHFVFQCKSYGLDPKTIYENMNEEDKKKNKEWEEEMRLIWERWLLQEVSDE